MLSGQCPPQMRSEVHASEVPAAEILKRNRDEALKRKEQYFKALLQQSFEPESGPATPSKRSGQVEFNSPCPVSVLPSTAASPPRPPSPPARAMACAEATPRSATHSPPRPERLTKNSLSLELHSKTELLLTSLFPLSQALQAQLHPLGLRSAGSLYAWALPAAAYAALKNELKKDPLVSLSDLPRFLAQILTDAAAAQNNMHSENTLSNDISSRLYSFQVEGVKFIEQHGGRGLIGDEMGVGKTIQAIAAASLLSERVASVGYMSRVTQAQLER
jgi:hypothetical protein